MLRNVHVLVRVGSSGHMPVEQARALFAALSKAGWRTRLTLLRRGKFHKLARLRAIADLMRQMQRDQLRPHEVNLMCGVVEPDFLEFAERSFLVVAPDATSGGNVEALRGLEGKLVLDSDPALFIERMEAQLSKPIKRRPPPFQPADVNLIAWDNGVGLSRDLGLLSDVLKADGLSVETTRLVNGYFERRRDMWSFLARMPRRGGNAGPRFGVSIMLEHIRPAYLGEAHKCAFVPNPEWCLPSDVHLLPRVDLAFTKTRHARALLEAQGCKTEFIGFTSEDRWLPEQPKTRTFLHVAGKSEGKNTALLLDTWLRHPEWPMLTVIQSPENAQGKVVAANINHRLDYVSETDLKALQNTHLFHVCPSKAEGFGHYIAEALSTGSIVLTTDGAPMNELVRPDYGLLIPVETTGRQNLSPTFHVGQAALENAVDEALALEAPQLEQWSRRAREAWEKSRRSFEIDAPKAVRALLGNRGS